MPQKLSRNLTPPLLLTTLGRNGSVDTSSERCIGRAQSGSGRPLRWVGRISYVFHILLQPSFDKIAAHLAPPTADYNAYLTARFFTAFFITLFVAWISFISIEKSILSLKRRFPMHSALH